MVHLARAYIHDPDSQLTVDLSQSEERRYFWALNSPIDDVADELGRQFTETHSFESSALALGQDFAWGNFSTLS